VVPHKRRPIFRGTPAGDEDVDCGVVTPAGEASMAARLLELHAGISAILERFRPDVAARSSRPSKVHYAFEKEDTDWILVALRPRTDQDLAATRRPDKSWVVRLRGP